MKEEKVYTTQEIEVQKYFEIPEFYTSVTNAAIKDRTQAGNVYDTLLRLKEYKSFDVNIPGATLDGSGNVVPSVTTFSFNHNVRSGTPLLYIRGQELSDVIPVSISDPFVDKTNFYVEITNFFVSTDPIPFNFYAYIYELLTKQKID